MSSSTVGAIPATATSAKNVLQDKLQSKGVACVCLKRGKHKLFLKDNNPIVYGGAVDRVEGQQPATGDAVIVADHQKGAFAWGMYNPDSMYRVRIMQYLDEAEADRGELALDIAALVTRRVKEAAALRASMCMPSSDVGAYRLLNSEGDRLSGVVADRYGDFVVVSSTAAWAERYKEDVTVAILQASGAKEVVWRPSAAMLKLEGWGKPAEGGGGKVYESAEEVGEEGEGAGEGAVESGQEVEVSEYGVKFFINLEAQKTGFYVDQRDSRRYLKELARGKRVLDVCCYTGGFALSAAAGGASEVTGVDSSEPALALARRNAQLNGIDACRFVKADMGEFVASAVKAGEQWDIVVLDPPKLAPSRSALRNATRKYVRLNAQAMKLVRPGGLLMTCSCSGAMTQSGTFYDCLKEASKQAHRQVTVVRKAGAGPDHTFHMAYPEGLYLTNVLLHVH